MAVWSSYTMKLDGQAEWLNRMGEKIINATRNNGGLPSGDTEGYMTVTLPTLYEQSRSLNDPEDDEYEVLKTGVPKLV